MAGLLGGSAGASAQLGSPAGPVPADLLAGRRAALLQRLASGAVLVRSAEQRGEETHAQDADFRQADDFFYLTGLEESGAVLVGRADSAGGVWTLFLPERVPAQEQWTGVRLGPGPEATALTGIARVRPAARFAGELAAALGRADGDRVGASGPDTLWLGGALPGACRVRASGCADPLLAPALAAWTGPVAAVEAHTSALRLVKDADELRRLRRAAAITGAAVREAMEAARPGMHEYELESIIEAGFRRAGAERVGFPSIVGSGPNSTVLHYDTNRREMRAGELVVVDVGAEFGYYTADVTRTIPVSGTFTPRQRAVYDLVLGAQRAAIEAVRPGVTPGALELAARQYMRAHSGTLCGVAPCDRYFVHGLSHWLGMDVHDVGGSGDVLAPGMVLTVEPGIYLAGEALGVRIEDDVLVTPTGHEVLTGSAPTEANEVEALMGRTRAR